MNSLKCLSSVGIHGRKLDCLENVYSLVSFIIKTTIEI